MKFKLDKSWWGQYIVFPKPNIELHSGLTVLIGCNGIGKSTMLRQFEQHICPEAKIPVIAFDNLLDGGAKALSKQTSPFVTRWNLDVIGALTQSSEGESIMTNFGLFVKTLGKFVRDNRLASELMVLIDATDSGLSIDNIIELKEFINKSFLPDVRKDGETDAYVLITSNDYELTCGEKCFDVARGKYITIRTYNEYKRLVLRSRKDKDSRKRVKRETRRRDLPRPSGKTEDK